MLGAKFYCNHHNAHVIVIHKMSQLLPGKDMRRARSSKILSDKIVLNKYSRSNLVNIGNDSLKNYDIFSETNPKLHVALMLHQKSWEKYFRAPSARIFSPCNSLVIL